MHRNQEVAADELIKLDVMNMSAWSHLGSVQDDKHVVGVDVHP